MLPPIPSAIWIERGIEQVDDRGPPPMVFEQLVEALVDDAVLERAIGDLLVS